MTEKLAPIAGTQQPANGLHHSPGVFAAWACAYALAVVYGSTVLGPGGFHFVPQNLATAWRTLLGTPYVPSGPVVRADWMANMMMLVPLGFLVTGGLWPWRGRLPRGLGPGCGFPRC